MKVTTTSVTQTANETLGSKEKVLWYLIIEEGDKKIIINVGEKTYNSVKNLTDGKQKNTEPAKK